MNVGPLPNAEASAGQLPDLREFRLFFESVPGLYLVLSSPELTILAATDAYLRATMTAREEIVGRPLFDIFSEDVADPAATGVSDLRTSIQRLLQSRSPDTMTTQRYAVRRSSAAGEGPEERHWRVTNRPVLGADGSVVFITHAVEDIGELRQAEGAIAAATMERDEAVRTIQLKTRFLGMVSHELRTPLTALSLQVERLQRHAHALDGANRESLQRIAFSSGRLREMIETLLEYARVEGGRIATNVAAFDLSDAIRRTIEIHRFRAEQKALAVRCALPDAPAVITGDNHLIELVISNLIDNAIKFTAAGSIEVALTNDEGGMYRVAIRDSGPGIPEDQHAAIFQPFEQLSSSAPANLLPGVGLGLALVRDMVAVLGGRIELVSSMGEGSTFALLIPPAAPDPREITRPGMQADSAAHVRR
jgi:signal transduction histidine kinase